MTKRIAILISGGGSNMVNLADTMTKDHPGQVCLVVSNVAQAGGLAKAAARGIPTQVIDHQPFGKDRSQFDAAVHKALINAQADIVCLAGFMRILTPGFIEQWRGRLLNIHPSLLPKYKGLNTHQRALDAGDKHHGCTVHEVTADLDDGPILGQARLTVAADDTAQTLAAKVLRLEHRLYPAVLRRYLDGAEGQIEIRG